MPNYCQRIKLRSKLNKYFFNCPKYIVPRTLISARINQQAAKPSISYTLNETQQNWINQADTFFIASCHPTKGADASHRGGEPGFIRVVNENKLIFSDYTGNNLFQTFGNLVVNPNAGL